MLAAGAAEIQLFRNGLVPVGGTDKPRLRHATEHMLLPWLNGPFIVHPIVALFLLIASPFFWWMAATIQKDLEKLDGESTTQSGEHPSSN
jgi:hypothetical protein